MCIITSQQGLFDPAFNIWPSSNPFSVHVIAEVISAKFHVLNTVFRKSYVNNNLQEYRCLPFLFKISIPLSNWKGKRSYIICFYIKNIIITIIISGVIGVTLTVWPLAKNWFLRKLCSKFPTTLLLILPKTDYLQCSFDMFQCSFEAF